MDANVTKAIFTSSVDGGVQEEKVHTRSSSHQQIMIPNSLNVSSPRVNGLYIKGYPAKEHGYAKTQCDSPVVRPVPLLSYAQQGANAKLVPLQITSGIRPAKSAPSVTPTVHVPPLSQLPGTSSNTGLSIANQQPILRPSNSSFSLILDPQAIKAIKGSRPASRYILDADKATNKMEQPQPSLVADIHTATAAAPLRPKHFPVGALSQTHTDNTTCNQQTFPNSVTLPRASRRKQDLLVRKPTSNLSPDEHREVRDDWPHAEKTTFPAQSPVGGHLSNSVPPVPSSSSTVSVTPLAQKLLKTLTRDPARCISDTQSLHQMHCQLRTMDCARKTLTAIRDLPDNCIVAEYVGVVKSFEEYDSTCSYQMHYNPHVLFYQVELKSFCIDASGETHISRYLNRSCTPNCYMTHVFCDGLPRFVICTREAVALDEELTIGFDFDYSLCQYPVRCVCGRSECPVTDSNLQKAYKHHSVEFGHANKESKYHNPSLSVETDRLGKSTRKKQRTKQHKSELHQKNFIEGKDFTGTTDEFEFHDETASFVESRKRSEEVKRKVPSNRRSNPSGRDHDSPKKRSRTYSFTDESTDNEAEQENIRKTKVDSIDREMRKDLARIRLAMREEQLRAERQKRRERKGRTRRSSASHSKVDKSQESVDDDAQSELLSPTGSDSRPMLKKGDEEKENVHKELRSPCSTAESSSTSYLVAAEAEMLKTAAMESHIEKEFEVGESACEVYIEERQSTSKNASSIFSPQVSFADNVAAEHELEPCSDQESTDSSSSTSSYMEPSDVAPNHPDQDTGKGEESKSKRKNRGRPRTHSKPSSKRQNSVSASDISTSSGRKRSFEYSEESSLFRTKRGRAFAEAQRKLFIELERQKKLEKFAECEAQNRESFLSPIQNEESPSESDKNESGPLPEQECSLIVYKSSNDNPMAKFSRPISLSMSVITEDHEADNPCELKTFTSPIFTPTPTSLYAPPTFSTPSTNEQPVHFPFTKKRWLSQAISQQRSQQQQLEEVSVEDKPVEAPTENLNAHFDSQTTKAEDWGPPDYIHQRQASGDINFHTGPTTSVSSPSVFFGCSPATNHSLLVNPKKRLMVQYSEAQSLLQEEQEQVESAEILKPPPLLDLSAATKSEESNDSIPDTPIKSLSLDVSEKYESVNTGLSKSNKGSPAPVSKISLKEYKMRRLMHDPLPMSTHFSCNTESKTVAVAPKSPEAMDEDGQLNISLLSPIESPPPFIFPSKDGFSMPVRTPPSPQFENPATNCDTAEQHTEVTSTPPVVTEDSFVKQAEDMMAFLIANTSAEISGCENTYGPATPSGDEADEPEDGPPVDSSENVLPSPMKEDVVAKIDETNAFDNETQNFPAPNTNLNLFQEAKDIDEEMAALLLKMRQRSDELREYEECGSPSYIKEDVVTTKEKQNSFSDTNKDSLFPKSNLNSVEDDEDLDDDMTVVLLKMRQRDDEIRDYQELKVLERQKKRLLQEISSVERSKINKDILLNAAAVASTPSVGTSPMALPMTPGQSVPFANAREKRVLLPTPLLPIPQSSVPLSNADGVPNMKDGLGTNLPPPEFLERHMFSHPVYVKGSVKRPLLGMCPPVEASLTPSPRLPIHPNEGPMHYESRMRRKRQRQSKEKYSRRQEYGRQHSHRHHRSRRSKRRKRRSSSSSSSSSASSSSSSSGSGHSTSSSSRSTSEESFMSPEQPPGGYKPEGHPRMFFPHEHPPPPPHMNYLEDDKFDEFPPNFHPPRGREHTDRRFLRPHFHIPPGVRGRGGAPFFPPRGWKPHPPQMNEYHPFPSRGGYMCPGGPGYRYPVQFHSRSTIETQHRH